MIAIKEKDAVYFASPMRVHNFVTQAKPDYRFEENGNIWHLNDGKGTIVMVVGKNQRVVDILRYSDVFDCEFSKNGMNQIVANIKKLLQGTNCFTVGSNIGLTVCIARGNRGYRITPLGAVFELGAFECVNECEEHLLATYECCQSIPDVRMRIEALYRRMDELAYAMRYPIAVIHTGDDSYSLLTAL